jgi:GT2 family glycosyltransferase
MISDSNMSTISIVMPIHGNWERCRASLQALRALQPAPREIILVTDGPMTGDRTVAGSLKVLSTGTAFCKGAGTARNLGTAIATGDLLLFVDSDVVVPANLLQQIDQALSDYPNADAIFGSYDAEPGGRNFLSQYKNLLHHFVHQNAPEEVATFWTGCGAIRAPIFRALGGFDESRGQLEDVELGFRLTKHGHAVRLCKSIQVKHLKPYTAPSLLRSDILDRALPWSRLILNADSWPSDANLQQGQTLSAVLLALFVVLFFGGGLLHPLLCLFSLLPLTGLLSINRAFYRFLLKHRGAGFLFVSLWWHWLSFGYASAVFAWAWGQKKISFFSSPWEEREPATKAAPVLISQ